MSETHAQRVVQFYDTHPINEDQIMEKIAAAGDGSVIDEGFLMAHDQDHFGGTEAVDILARLAEIGPSSSRLVPKLTSACIGCGTAAGSGGGATGGGKAFPGSPEGWDGDAAILPTKSVS